MLMKTGSLPEVLIERGKIDRTVIYKNERSTEITEISLLELSPGAKIKVHWHYNDSEIYYKIDSKEIEYCRVGEKHGLENKTKEILRVISIKCAKELTGESVDRIIKSLCK